MRYEATREHVSSLNANAEKIVRCIEDEVGNLERKGHGGYDSMLDAIFAAAKSWAILEPDMKAYRGGSHVAVHYRAERVLVIVERRA